MAGKGPIVAHWEKERDWVDGACRELDAPVIISASRATDIPAFYGDWLLRRLEQGWVKWVNPFSGKPAYVSLARARLFVFWTKNPGPLMAHLDTLDRKGLNYYFQFTLNDYGADRLEPGVPPLDERIATFIALSGRIGPEKVIWRFDPLVLTDRLDETGLLEKIAAVGDRLHRHTRRLVISFADVQGYANVLRNVSQAGIRIREFDGASMERVARGIAELNRGWGLEIVTCAEGVDLSDCGIGHGRCVDDCLIDRLFGHDEALMDFLRRGGREKDKGQRKACGCIRSKDIGAYNTCPHLCAYCYANAGHAAVARAFARHRPDGGALAGD